MFEFKFAKKYLLPEKECLSASLMGLLSTLVIALVIWLVSVFLTVTSAIENNWIKKLTSLNAPIRIHPTNTYYSSYYYQIDSFCQASNFSLKTIREKLHCAKTDPYNDEVDEELPAYFPTYKEHQTDTADPVKDLFAVLKNVSKSEKFLYPYDYEVCPAMFKQRLYNNAELSGNNQQNNSFVSQLNFLISIPNESYHIQSLLTPPGLEDINNLLYSHSNDPDYLQSILANIDIKEFYSIANHWQLPFTLLPEKITLPAYALCTSTNIVKIVIGSDSLDKNSGLIKGRLVKSGDSLYFLDKVKRTDLSHHTPLIVNIPLRLSVNPLKSCKNKRYFVTSSLFNYSLDGPIKLKHVKITKAKIHYDFSCPPTITPPWAYLVKKSRHKKTLFMPDDSVLLPIHYADKSSHIGDQAEICYQNNTSTATQEQKKYVRIAGFYDPGMFNVGYRSILANYDLVHQIYTANPNTSLDPIMSNGIQIWCPIKNVDTIVSRIQQQIREQGLSKYWNVVPYYEYECAKGILQQFKSDRYLLILIGIIILMVACSNIVSLLILIVNNKKKQIGILLSLGAKKSSIAIIFSLCAILIGILSCLIGSILALITLKNLDLILHCISSICDPESFSLKLLRSTLPKKISLITIWPVFIITPILSVLAAVIPTYRACRIEPSTILRAE